LSAGANKAILYIGGGNSREKQQGRASGSQHRKISLQLEHTTSIFASVAESATRCNLLQFCPARCNSLQYLPCFQCQSEVWGTVCGVKTAPERTFPQNEKTKPFCGKNDQCGDGAGACFWSRRQK
jgi:hypothetical protein